MVEKRPKTRFYGRVQTDPTRLTSTAGTLSREIVQHLEALLDARVEVTIEIRAEVPGGITEQAERTVSENSRSLKFELAEFDE